MGLVRRHEVHGVGRAQEPVDLARRSQGGPGPLDREEVALHGTDQRGRRRAHREVVRVVEAEGQHPRLPLLGVLRADPPGEQAVGGEVAAWRRGPHAIVQGEELGGLRAPTGVPHHAEPVTIHLRPRGEGVEGAHGVPRLQPGLRPAQQERLRPGEIVRAGPPRARSSVLARVLPALALVERIEHEGGEAAACAERTCLLVPGVGLALVRVPAGDQHAGNGGASILREIEVGRNGEPGPRRDAERDDGVTAPRQAGPLDRLRRSAVQRGERRTRAAERGTQLLLPARHSLHGSVGLSERGALSHSLLESLAHLPDQEPSIVGRSVGRGGDQRPRTTRRGVHAHHRSKTTWCGPCPSRLPPSWTTSTVAGTPERQWPGNSTTTSRAPSGTAASRVT